MNNTEDKKLHNILYKRDITAIKELIASGCDLDLSGEDKRTPLMLAIILGLAEITKLLIDAGANIHSMDANGTNAMHWAAGSDNIFALNCLLKAGADINIKNSFGMTPIYVAAMYGQPDNVRFLARRGADINLADNNGGTPLHNAAFQMKIGMMQLLITHHADINIKQNNELTPMMLLKERHPVRYRLCSEGLYKLSEQINSRRLNEEDSKKNIKTGFNFDI